MAVRGWERYADVGLLVIRLGFGLGFVGYHGLPKVLDGPERWARTGGAMRSVGIEFAPEWWGLAAALAETAGGLLIAAGFLFRPATAAVFVVMVVATVNHYVTGMGTPAHSFKNAWVLAGLFVIGAGRYSVDHVLAARRAEREAAGRLGDVRGAPD